MSANVETMMYVREVPWHGQGIKLDEAPNSAVALEKSGLNWHVTAQPVYLGNDKRIENVAANVRDTDGSVFGIVSDRYKIVQNADAFKFTDELIGGDVRYETAGSLNGGRTVWMLAKLSDITICGDKIDPYICFTNSHDGSGAVRVLMTPVRVVCNNTLNIALRESKRSWSAKHTTNVNNRIVEARQTLELSDIYLHNLANEAEHLANVTIDTSRLENILSQLFPIDKDNDTQRVAANMEQMRNNFNICYMRPDIVKFKGTAWGVINAAADMVAHCEPTRKTSDYAENNWGRIMCGHPILDRVVSLVG